MLPLSDRLPTARPPLVNYAIIGMNVGAFIWEKMVLSTGYPPLRFLTEWGLVPAHFVEAPTEQIGNVLTSMFLHDPGGFMHLGGNMLFLWIFGDNVEDAMGSLRYALFYLLSGVAAAFAQILIGPGSLVPMIGASGAISGVLAAYGSLYPRSPITVLNPIPLLWLAFGLTFVLPAWLVIAEYFVVNLLNAFGSLGTRGGGVAFFAHLGGFVAGILLIRVFMIGRFPRDHERWKGWRPPPRARYGPRAPTSGDRDPYGRRQRGPWDF